MSSPAPQVRNQDISYWNTETCLQVKYWGSITLLALGAITACVGLLFILAQQGIPLGGLNAAANAIEPILIYFGTAFAGVTALVSTAYVVYTSTTRKNISENPVSAELPPNLTEYPSEEMSESGEKLPINLTEEKATSAKEDSTVSEEPVLPKEHWDFSSCRNFEAKLQNSPSLCPNDRNCDFATAQQHGLEDIADQTSRDSKDDARNDHLRIALVAHYPGLDWRLTDIF